jgi:hypothetical protein
VRPPYVVVVAALLLAGCSDDGEAPVESSSRPAVETSTPAAELDEALRDELVAMQQRDQDERTGIDGDTETDQDRTDRLEEIVGEHGWPGYDLVGKEGEDAAWTIAQHSDLDPEFQAEALELLRAAVDAGQASPGNLAYLEDRVAVAEDRPQVYGTQVGCGADGPVPQPIEDPDGVEQRRADAGLGTLEDYLTEMTEICSSGG